MLVSYTRSVYVILCAYFLDTCLAPLLPDPVIIKISSWKTEKWPKFIVGYSCSTSMYLSCPLCPFSSPPAAHSYKASSSYPLFLPFPQKTLLWTFTVTYKLHKESLHVSKNKSHFAKGFRKWSRLDIQKVSQFILQQQIPDM